MHPTIVIALNFLENGNYVDYFEALDPLVPPQLKTIYAEHKGKFMADQKPFNFFQQLSVFAKEVARYLAESEEEAPADLPKHLLDEPFRPPIFLGRTNELQQLHDQLFDTSQDQTSIALISGSGGIGKTTFAINYYHKYADKYHHLAWLLAEPNLETALLNLAASLKVDYEECMNNHQRIKMLTKVLASLEKPCLLIIDHATSLKQLEQQFLTLNSIGHFHVLITTRLTQFKKLPIVELGPLDKEPALELFKTYYEAFEDEEETLFYEVCDAVRGNTLLIELMAKNLNHFNTELKKRYPLATLVADLHQSLLTIQKSDEVSTTYQAKGLGLRTESIQSIVLAMYDLSELTTKENRVLSALAMLPAEDIPFSLLDQLLSKEGEEDDVDHTLLSLAKKGLVEYNKQEKSFKCSPLIQEIIRHKNKTQLLTNGKVLLESLSQELDYQGGFGNLSNNSYQKAVTLVHYGDYLINHTQALWEDSPLEIQYFIAQLCERLANFYKISGNIALALDYLSSYQKLMHELCNAHPDLHDYKYKLAYGHELTGFIYLSWGDYEQALKHFNTFRELLITLNELYPTNTHYKTALMNSSSHIGDTYLAKSEVETALDYFKRNHELVYVYYQEDVNNPVAKNNLSLNYTRLADIYIRLQDYEQALVECEKSIEIAKELYASYPDSLDYKNNLASHLLRLGQIHYHRNQVEQSIQVLHECIQLCQELYEAYPHYTDIKNILALCYQWLGWIHEAEPNLEEAQKYYLLSHPLLVALVETAPNHRDYRANFEWIDSKLKELEA